MLTVLVLLCWTAAPECAIWFVRADGSGDYATIQAAIDAVAANSVIELADGVYTGAGNRDLDFHGKALTIRSASGSPADCVVDCQGAGRGFYFHTGETGASAVKGITVRNGYAADHGGGIYISGAAPAILNCVITDCDADQRGGGIYGFNAQPVVNSCVISNNTAAYGGGIAYWNQGGDLWNDLVTGNNADYGDAVYLYGPDIYVHGCTFDANYGRFYEAALYGDSGGGFTFRSCIIWNNDGYPMIRNALASYSCVFGGFTGTGNISSNPQFVSGPGGGWYLATASPCVNAGGPYMASSFTTADGAATRDKLTTRTDEANDSGTVDMGYHHYHIYPLAVPGRYATIQAALDDAWSGEQIDVASGTYHERLQLRGRAVVLNGHNAADTIVDGDGAGAVVTINGGEGRGAVVRNLQIVGGVAAQGGGILVDAASPTIAQCSIEQNHATGQGGGLAVYFGRPLLDGTFVQDNSAGNQGGGVYCAGAGTRLALDGALIRRNEAVGDGGGLYAAWTQITAVETLVYGNAAGRGGGVALMGSTLNGTRLTVAHNAAPTAGGGILCDDMGHAVLANSIVAFSTAGAAVACLLSGEADFSCCDVMGNVGGDWTGGLAGQEGVNGNFAADPLFCDPATGIYSLHSNSPCATANSPVCGQIGAFDAACGPYVITVAPGGAGQYPTIQAAIDAASEGVIVQLLAGTYTGDGNRDLDYHGKAITVESASGDATDTIIDCQGSTTTPHRGFTFHSGEDSTSLLRNVTVRGGRTGTSSAGGAVLFSNGSAPKIAGCVFTQNGAYDGGAMHCYQSSPIIVDCRFGNNTASDAGGAMTVNTAAPQVRGCVFTNNWAYWGGGAVSDYAAATKLYGCEFRFNASNNWGGAVLTSDAASRTEIRGCIFQNNGASQGGALYGRNGSITTIASCSFHDNTASSTGGTIWLNNAGSASVTNSILWAQVGYTYPVVALRTSSSASFACCDVRGGLVAVDRDGSSSVTWGSGNLDADPQFCGPDDWFLGLRSTSPCAQRNSPTCGLIGADPRVCSATGVDNGPPPAAAAPVLHPAFPNPFNPRTTIRFDLPRESRVRLTVHDVEGRCVAVLAEGELPAGAHALVWDGRDRAGRAAASGLYFCRLRADEGVWSRRMVLVR